MRFLPGRRLRLVVLLGMALAAMAALTAAAAAPPAPSGQITFARFNPALDDTQVYVVNPDGTGQRLVQGPTDIGEGPRWFPDGTHIATGGSPALPAGGSRIINPDDGTYRDVGGQDPTLFNPCGAPSPDGRLLLCETFSKDGSANGIHTIRSSDGGGLTQITSNPGGDDVPGGWSPDGKRIVFQRISHTGDSEGLFVVNANGTGLKQILPADFDLSSFGRWSPQGNEIVFSRHVTPDVHSSIWVVHPDGSGLHEINVQPASDCGGANSDPTAEGCNEPTWSPDGRKIAFVRSHNNDVDGEIYTVNVDGTGLMQVTQAPGSGSPDWGTRTISPPFITKTDNLCAAISARLSRTLGKFPYPNFNPLKPNPKTLPLVGKHFAKALPIRRAIPGQLHSLGEPTSGKQAWDALRSLALQENSAGIKQVSAALASNAKAFVRTVKQINKLHQAITARATAQGFPKSTPCGRIF